MLGSAVFRTGVAPGGALAGPWVKNELWNKARSVPSLDLRFADNKSLVDATTGQNLVTFTRASSGTYVDSQGVIRTATTNLLLRSEEFDNASWTKHNLQAFGSGSVANTTIAPNGTLTADKIVENTATAQHMVYQNMTSEIGKAYVLTFYAKAAERTFVTVSFSGGGLPSDCRFGVNLNTGEIVSGSTSGSPELTQVTPIGDGWYRIALIKTMPAASTLQPRILMSTNGTAQTYLGDGTSGIYLWGAQLEQSNTVGEYIPTTSTINSAPRFDHNPITGESLGLLVEEARTNLSQQSDNFADVYWVKTDCTITSNESTAPDGTLTANLWTNTASPGIVASSTITKDATARTYTGSLWVKGGGTAFTMSIDSTTTTNRGRAIFNMSSGTLTSVANDGNFTNTSGTITAYANGWYRLTVTTTTSTFTGIRLRPFFSGTGSTARIWGAQIEEGAFPTSYIPTTTATVTRSADVASITGSNFSSWYRQDEGTVFSEFSAAAYSTASYAISDGTNSNRILVDRGSTGTRYVITNAGVAQSGGAQTPYTLNSFAKTSLGYALDNCNLAVGGVLQTLDTSATIPSTIDRLLLGVNAGGAGYGNGPIKRFTFWPRRLSDPTLQEITQ